MTILLDKSELEKFYIGNDKYDIDFTELMKMYSAKVKEKGLGFVLFGHESEVPDVAKKMAFMNLTKHINEYSDVLLTVNKQLEAIIDDIKE